MNYIESFDKNDSTYHSDMQSDVIKYAEDPDGKVDEYIMKLKRLCKQLDKQFGMQSDAIKYPEDLEGKVDEFKMKLKRLGMFAEFILNPELEKVLLNGLIALVALEQRFKSGNNIPVERVKFKGDLYSDINELCILLGRLLNRDIPNIPIKNGYIYQSNVAVISRASMIVRAPSRKVKLTLQLGG